MNNLKQRLIFLGSNSFIASNLIKSLSNSNFKIISFTKKDINLEKSTSISKLQKKIKNNDLIFFAAGTVPVKNNDMLISNIIMMSHFLKGIQSKKIKHIFYLSSDAVYADTFDKINEKSFCMPNSLHGIMHFSREIMIKNHGFNSKLTFFRPTLIYGYGDPHNGYGPNSFLRLAENGKNINIFGKGEELRDHIHINDVIHILKYCVINQTEGIFNIASGKVISFNKIAKIFKNKFPDISINYLRRATEMPHNGYRAFNITKLKKLIKNRKFIEIEEWVNHAK